MNLEVHCSSAYPTSDELHLPPELWAMIFSFLQPPELRVVSLVCGNFFLLVFSCTIRSVGHGHSSAGVNRNLSTSHRGETRLILRSSGRLCLNATVGGSSRWPHSHAAGLRKLMFSRAVYLTDETLKCLPATLCTLNLHGCP